MGTKRRRPRRPRAFDRTIKHQHKHQHKRTKKMTKLHAVLVGSLLLAGGSGAMAQASDPLAQIERIPNEILGAVTLNPVLHVAGAALHNADPAPIQYESLPDVGEPG